MTLRAPPLFFLTLEYEYLGKDPEFHLLWVDWKGETWTIAAVPKKYSEQIRNTATEAEICFTEGAPSMISFHQQVDVFPVTGPNTFTITRNSRMSRQAEVEKMNALFVQHGEEAIPVPH